jgi:hypothetical protein
VCRQSGSGHSSCGSSKGVIAGTGKRRCAGALQTLSPGSPLPIIAAYTYLLRGLKCSGIFIPPLHCATALYLPKKAFATLANLPSEALALQKPYLAGENFPSPKLELPTPQRALCHRISIGSACRPWSGGCTSWQSLVIPNEASSSKESPPWLAVPRGRPCRQNPLLVAFKASSMAPAVPGRRFDAAVPGPRRVVIKSGPTDGGPMMSPLRFPAKARALRPLIVVPVRLV